MKTSLWAPLLCLASLPAAAAPAGRPPNVVLISMDAARPDHAGAYGYRRDTTPEIDRLAAEGVLFENAYAQAPWTVPSLATVMTSRFPEGHGVTYGGGMALTEAFPTLAGALARAGYRTGAFVTGLPRYSRFGLTRGFATVRGVEETVPMEELVREGSAWALATSTAPFFLWIHGWHTHLPYWSPAPWRERYEQGYAGPVHRLGIDGPESGPLANFIRIYNGEASDDPALLEVVREIQASPRDIAHFAVHYDGGYAYMDRQIGALRGLLKAAGVEGDTIWIVTADHGEHLGARTPDGGPPKISHPGGDLREPLLRVPLVIKDPAGRRGKRVSEPVMLADLAPTVLSRLGLAAPDGMVGRDLGGWILRGRKTPPGRYVYASDKNHGKPGWCRAILSEGWKLRGEPGVWRLFDLRKDPGEREDLIRREPRRFLALAKLYLDEVAAIPGAEGLGR